MVLRFSRASLALATKAAKYTARAGVMAVAISTIVTSTAVHSSDTPSGMSDYQRWLASTQQDFQNYLDENDKAFIGFLKQRWESVDTQAGQAADNAPKPDTMPVAPPAVAPVETPVEAPIKAPIETPVTDPIVVVAPLPETPKTKLPAPQTPKPQTPEPQAPENRTPTPQKPQANEPSVTLAFYGHRLSVPFNNTMTRRQRGRISPDSIASGWEALARSEYQTTQTALENTRNILALSDWATARLVADFSRATAPDTRSRTLLSWFLLVKMGYDARLAHNNDLYLLMPADDDVFGVTYFTLKGTRYYALPIDGKVTIAGSVYTYKKQHETAATPVRFQPPETFTAAGTHIDKSLTFQHHGQEIQVAVSYPAAQVEYLNTLPQLALPRYPVIAMPDDTRRALAAQLMPLLTGQSEEAAVNTLLNFVQNAFAYQTDDEQFREENYLFPLETLHYRASDCEDRAALFSQLVHDLLGLPVVLLDYPGHVAAAVAFSTQVPGDALVYNGRQYTVTDPTYINARAGMTMPEYAGKTADVVEIF